MSERVITIQLTDGEDRWLQQTLYPYSTAHFEPDGDTDEIASAILAKLENARLA